MSPLAPRPVAAGADAAVTSAAPASASRLTARESLPLQLLAFAALALYGAAHWRTLVEGTASWRMLLVVAIGTAGAAALGYLGTLDAPRRWLVHLGALAVVVVMFFATVAATGLELRLLEPTHWGELFDGLDRGLAGAQVVEWPYAGADEWIALSILLGVPSLVTLAAALAFWPARRGRGALKAAGLGALLVLYGLPATEHEPSSPLLDGLVLLILIAAWLWMPRLGRRDAAVAAAVVVGVGIVSLPAAAALDSGKPWWDYGGLSWFGDGEQVAFDWTHSYGPMDWPRDGTTLLNVKSDRPHYWKAESLDVFDGFRWVRSPAQDGASVGADLPLRAPNGNGRWDYFERNPRWDVDARFTVRSLSTELIIGLGTSYAVTGLDSSPQSSGDGTLRVNDPLQRGDTYAVAAYAPDPSADQMRGSPLGYPGELARSTQIFLPRGEETALDGTRRGSASYPLGPIASVPLRGASYDDGGLSERVLRSSPYARVYELAQSLTTNQPTAYDAVKAVENYLQDNYIYSERPPSQEYPLAAFLFEDRIGYCQQFSGAMALLLRMSGIPARIATGFTPGSFNKDSGEYRVRDLDAHSWVEVYFTGIGWVPFDPTPSAAPAESQSTGASATSAARADAGEVQLQAQGTKAASERGTDTGAAAAAPDAGGSALIGILAIVALALIAAVLLLWARVVRRRRALEPEELADAQLAELRRALERLGWDVPAQTTLLDLERRLDRLAGPTSARYAAGLRAHRYDPRGPGAPSPADRRGLRRELTAHRGLRGRVSGFFALPPGGPRPA